MSSLFCISALGKRNYVQNKGFFIDINTVGFYFRWRFFSRGDETCASAASRKIFSLQARSKRLTKLQSVADESDEYGGRVVYSTINLFSLRFRNTRSDILVEENDTVSVDQHWLLNSEISISFEYK